MSFEDFKQVIKEEFMIIEPAFILIDPSINAEVISIRSLKEERELTIACQDNFVYEPQIDSQQLSQGGKTSSIFENN